jgi:hypothetical protein
MVHHAFCADCLTVLDNKITLFSCSGKVPTENTTSGEVGSGFDFHLNDIPLEDKKKYYTIPLLAEQEVGGPQQLYFKKNTKNFNISKRVCFF